MKLKLHGVLFESGVVVEDLRDEQPGLFVGRDAVVANNGLRAGIIGGESQFHIPIEAVQKAGGFVISKLALASLSSAFHAGFFYLIDIPYWLPMGIFAGVVSQFIPTIGTYIGVALPALFAVFDDPVDVLWIVIFATVYQQIENYVFTPRISTKTMDINSGVALASVFVGAALFGPIGAIIGIPIAAIVIAIFEAYGQRYEVHPYVERNAD